MTWVGQVPFEDAGMTDQKMDLLKELAENNDYWKRAYQFVRSSANRKLFSLSDNQRRWLTTIILDLDDELHKRGQRV